MQKIDASPDGLMDNFKSFLNELSPVSTESWNRFSTLFTPKILKKGDYYIKEGQIANEIGFLQTGVLRAFYRNNEGVEYNKHFFLPYCFIGGYASLISKIGYLTPFFYLNKIVFTLQINNSQNFC